VNPAYRPTAYWPGMLQIIGRCLGSSESLGIVCPGPYFSCSAIWPARFYLACPAARLLPSLPGASLLVMTTNSCGIFAALVSPSLDRTGVAHDLAGLM
jgi:hypothetical protein